MKSELPDVFFIDPTDTNYPINFAGVPFPGTANPLMGTNSAYAGKMLPLGNSLINNPGAGALGDGNVDVPQPGLHGVGDQRCVVPDRRRHLQEHRRAGGRL